MNLKKIRDIISIVHVFVCKHKFVRVTKRPSGAPLRTLSKLHDVPVGFVIPPILRLCIALFAIVEGWLLLDIG